jgi:pilus assembly protein CpaB
MKQKNLVLMVVAVGCGLVAAFLTSQMSARSASVEQVEVLVAAKDLPVGTMLSKDELKNLVKTKKVPKDGLPPAFVTDMTELENKRLSRAVRTEETFNPADLSKGGVITLPPGMDMISLQVGASNAAAGFVGPGSRVDILATARLQNRMVAFPLLVNMLVVAVDTQTTYSQNGTFPTLNTVSFAVDRKQALLLALAKSRGCSLELLLRHPEKNDVAEKYRIEDVLRMLQDNGNAASIGGPNGQQPDDGGIDSKGPQPKPGEKVEPPAPKAEVVKILVATEDLPAGTRITKDLAAKFKTIELPKGVADDAFPELADSLMDKEFKHGLAKGQWITGALVGDPSLKPRPERFEFVPPKDDPRAEAAPASRRNTHDVTIHGNSGSRTFRYVEVNPGEWRLLGEVSPADRASDGKPDGKHEKPRID